MKLMYDNPENISPDEILRKMINLGFGPNRSKRFQVLKNYSVEKISKDEWIKKYCK